MQKRFDLSDTQFDRSNTDVKCLDISTEKLLTFRELSRRIPHRRSNRPLALSTIHRWRAFGIKGIHLEAIRVGGSWLTSEEAFSRFCHRLTTAVIPKAHASTHHAAVSDMESNIEKQLDHALGVKRPRTTSGCKGGTK